MADSMGSKITDENDDGEHDRSNGQLHEEVKLDITTERKPWKIILQNVEGLVTENSKRKVDFMKDFVQNDKIAIMNITETWLDKNIKDDAEIEGYTIFRCDRKEIKRGGTAIYVHNKLEAIKICELSHVKCEVVAVSIRNLQTLNIVVYRPPKTKLEEFNVILNKIKEIFNQIEKPEPTVILSGDFNFPFVKWKKLENNACAWEYVANTNATSEEKQQFERLMDICNNQCMLQMIDEPTRENNTLDLIFTNETSIATTIEVNKTKISDHNCIEISTNYVIDEQPNVNELRRDPNCVLKSLNFHAKSINWNVINENIKSKSWKDILENKDTIESGREFERLITQLCIENIPKKMYGGKKKIPKERKKLLNRIKMLKRDKRKAYSKEKKTILENKIVETEGKLLEHRRREKLDREEQAIECMKKNPRMFYSYINKQKNRRNEIGPFKNGDELVYKGEEICNSLKSQYVSQFSYTNDKRENEQFFDDYNSTELYDIKFTAKEIEEAINELSENSSAGPDGIPAILLKKCKETISVPLAIILRKSLDEGKIPENLKMAYVTPIHKGGSRQKPENYRPVSITSHVMKIYERVVKKEVMKHLIENQQINDGQHGFVKGRSTQSQLLAHYSDIYETLSEGKRMDTIFLDFAKAFDKVDHEILLKKVRKHGISGKIGKWIREFLKNRKFRVVANGCMSEEEHVLSGVPQGTVLAAILFAIMISDLDDKIKECIVRSFADDTRVNNKIGNDSDTKIMQEDLETIYKWAIENKMQFNENKFEQMAHGSIDNVELRSYKSPSGEDIEIKNKAKDLGILANTDMKFKEHIENITTSSRIIMGMLLRTFSTREAGPMMKLFNTFIKSKMEYCCVVWSPYQQNLINQLENVQRTFTSRIEGIQELDYHERLKKLNMYSLERRRDRYMIIYGWQQIEEIKENVLKLKTSWRGIGRRIISKGITTQIEGRRLKRATITNIHYSPARRIERAFNSIPNYLRNITGVKTDTFKARLDKWLHTVPDLPKCGRYAKWVSASSNGIQDQAANLRRG